MPKWMPYFNSFPLEHPFESEKWKTNKQNHAVSTAWMVSLVSVVTYLSLSLKLPKEFLVNSVWLTETDRV